jgi:predicted exporter
MATGVKPPAGGSRKSPRAVAAAVLLITALSAACLPFLSFDGHIDVMLPDRSELRDLFAFLREIQVADKVLVTLGRRDGSADADALCAAADRYAAGLDPALAAPLATGFRTEQIAQDFARLARQLPDYTEPADFAKLGEDTSPAGVRRALEALRRKVQQPEGMFAASAARADPLDWNGRTVKKILGAVAAFGYRAVPVQGHLMDQERRHLLLVLQTPVPMTDASGVRRLLKHLGERAADLPAGVEARLVCGHLHTAGNEAVIRRDITVTSVAVTAVFVALFFGVYRDPRANLVVLVPFLASVPALAAAACFFSSFSYIVVGFGSVIAGIAIDYGIHTYVAARSDQPARSLRLIRKPVALSALTTLCVFVAFCFSSMPAYRQLGLFASFAILVSLAYAFWALPLFVEQRGAPRLPDADFAHSRRGAWVIVALAALAFVGGGVLASRLKMEADVSKLDGTPKATLDEEKRALSIWGGGESLSAILSVEAPDEAEALRLNDRVYAGLIAAGVAPSSISSLSPISPSDETRRARRRAWREYWTAERALAFRADVAREGAALDFSEAAFQPFWQLFEAWRAPAPELPCGGVGFLQPLRDRFLHARGGVTRVVTFLPDEPQTLAAAQALRAQVPSLRVVSRRAFSASLTQTISREVARVSALAALLIAAVTFAVIRRVGMVVLASLPALAGLLWGGAAMALLGLPLNISNLIAGIIVLGLAIDYGICMVYGHRYGMTRDVFRAVTLSAVTTALGAGVLLLARHPAFFSIGVTLVAGVSVGYLFAWLVLPAVQTLWPSVNPAAPAPGEKEGA